MVDSRVLVVAWAALALGACGDREAASPSGQQAAPLSTTPGAPAMSADQIERLERLEARLVETESRLRVAEAQAAAAEARAAGLAERLPTTEAPALDPQIDAEDRRIKAEATGVADGEGWVPPEPVAYDDAADPTKAEAYNIDPRDDD